MLLCLTDDNLKKLAPESIYENSLVCFNERKVKQVEELETNQYLAQVEGTEGRGSLAQYRVFFQLDVPQSQSLAPLGERQCNCPYFPKSTKRICKHILASLRYVRNYHSTIPK